MKKFILNALLFGAVVGSGAAILNGCSNSSSSSGATFTLKASNSQN